MDKHLDINLDESPTRQIATLFPNIQFNMRQQHEVQFVSVSKLPKYYNCPLHLSNCYRTLLSRFFRLQMRMRTIGGLLI